MKVPKWLIVVALGLTAFLWWYQGGDVTNRLPDWLRTRSAKEDSGAIEYTLVGGFPAAATMSVFKKFAALSQGNNSEAMQKLKHQGLVWETIEGQQVRLLGGKPNSKLVQVQDIGSFDSYWTYAEALQK
ncbi:MAG: hypothetical protein PVF76_13235 [Syntrophobacterales bacterium]|jgi:hypothetical protein